MDRQKPRLLLLLIDENLTQQRFCIIHTCHSAACFLAFSCLLLAVCSLSHQACSVANAIVAPRAMCCPFRASQHSCGRLVSSWPLHAACLLYARIAVPCMIPRYPSLHDSALILTPEGGSAADGYPRHGQELLPQAHVLQISIQPGAVDPLLPKGQVLQVVLRSITSSLVGELFLFVAPFPCWRDVPRVLIPSLCRYGSL